MLKFRTALAALAATLSLGAGTAVAQGPPPPTAANGLPVQTIATGIPTPVAIAFDANTVFVAAAGAEDGSAPGGVFAIPKTGGEAVKIPGLPPSAFGVAFHDGTLYVTAGKQILAFSGWNGTTFASQRTVYTGGKAFPGFGGIAVGPDGRLYAGTFLDVKYDAKRDPRKYAQAVVSLKPDGGALRVVSRGMRQPWQLAFVAGSRYPYVSVLSKDKGKIPPDAIVQARPGRDFGFGRGCDFGLGKGCKRYAKAAIVLPEHSSPMGLASIGTTLYVALFAGLDGKSPSIVTVPASGGTPKPFLTGFVAPVLSVGIDQGNVYAGDITGSIYKVAAAS